jgi:multidrug efflux pump
VWLSQGDNNIFTQIGLMVLVGLSAKNAILIVEFARELEIQGRTIVYAAIEASRLRLRPILMTSIAFIMGVIPLVVSTGAGSEMRRAMGIAVFFGMLGVTLFGLLLTPVFYVLLRQLTGGKQLKDRHGKHPHIHGPDDDGRHDRGNDGKGDTSSSAVRPSRDVSEPALED